MASGENLTVEYSDGGVDLEWDAFVSSINGDIHQTSLWGEYEFFGKNWAVRRFVIKKGGCIVAGCQISVVSVRYLGQIGYIQMGPCAGGQLPANVLNLMMNELKNQSRKNKFLYLIAAPNYPDAGIVQHLELNRFVVKKKKLPPHQRLEATLLLNLSLPENELLAQMKSMRKRNIRKGLTMPATFKTGGRDDLATFFELSVITAKRHKSYPGIETLESLYRIWDLMYPHGYIHLYLGIVDGETVCGALSFAFGNTFQYSYWGWNGKYSDYYLSDAFQWNLIRYAKEKGYSYYDFVQLDLECVKAITSKEEIPDSIKSKNFYGPTLFKMQFGGAVVTYPDVYTYYPSRIKYFLIHKVASFVLEHVNINSIIGFLYRRKTDNG